MSVQKYKIQILNLLSKIPIGKVTTYGAIAKSLHISSPRLVGNILHHNTDPQHFPCHRVVFANGNLSTSYAFGGIKQQKERLQHEGVTFIKNRVNLVLHLHPSI